MPKVRFTADIDPKLYEWMIAYSKQQRISRNEVLGQAIKQFKEGLGMRLEVVERSQADTDWSIGYLDSKPAVGGPEGDWYLVPSNVKVHNPFDGYVWYIAIDGTWQSVAKSTYGDEEISHPDEWTAGGPDYTE